MKVISPLAVAGSIFTSSNIPEPDTASGADPALWASGTYAEGALVSRITTHAVYRRLAPSGAHAVPPEDAPEQWAYVRPTNRWAPFDQVIGTAATKTGAGVQSITYVLTPGQVVSSIAFFELVANTVQIQVTDAGALPAVYDETFALDETELLDWYGYFFDPFSTRETLVIRDLPAYASAVITITISGPATTSVGSIVIGTDYSIGSVGYGSASAGIRDFSRKVTDEVTGYTSVQPGRFKKTMRVRFRLDEDAVNFVHRLLTSLRSAPAVWIGDNGAGLEPLIIYGFAKDFQLELEQRKISYYAIEIEGLV
jgi:hypothetical protein